MYTADFETTTKLDDCRVWAWAVCEIGKPENKKYGNSVKSFLEFCWQNKDNKYYFHNLKFDGEFIISALFKYGFRYTDKRKLKPLEFTALISDTGQFYTIKVCFKDNTLVEFRDSLKLLNFSVDEVAKAFDLPVQKLKLDYKAERTEGHELTKEEIEYISADVEIMALALDKIFKMGFSKLTQGACAIHEYKTMLTPKRFYATFPPPAYDKDIRQSYKGGFVYLNPKYIDKDVGAGVVLDVNSLYPSRMYYELLPWGEPKYFDGKYEYDNRYPLYIQMFRCEFDVKDNFLPTLQLKGNFRFLPTEYVTSSDGDAVTLCLTSVDLDLFFAHYNVYNIEYIRGWKFRAQKGLFKGYIDKWMKEKIKATKAHNKPMRTWSKVMLNSLYGKFALNPVCARKHPYLENGIVKYRVGQKETRQPVYLPVGTFITAYARAYTIQASQKIKSYSIEKYGEDLYVYSDTDSIHTLLPVDDLKALVDIDDVRLGAWKVEEEFTRARFLRAKTYAEEVNGSMKVTCAGLPDKCKIDVTWENFHPGAVYSGKLMPTHAEGGIVLVEKDFTIRV